MPLPAIFVGRSPLRRSSRRARRLDHPRDLRQKHRRNPLARFSAQRLTLGLGLLIGVAVLFAWLRTGPSPNAPGPKRVAVLPFENIGDSADAYFADGVTDAVRGKLVGLPGLQVTARGSSSQYRGTTKTPPADRPGVGSTIPAHCHRALGESRESSEPGAGHTGTGRGGLGDDHVATTVRCRAPGVFQVQAEIAVWSRKAVDLELSDSSRRHLAERPTQSLEAYDAYLRGRRM